MKLHYSFLALGLACAACSSTSTAPTEPQGTMDTNPVIVRMVSRDTTIVARTGANGPVYSLMDNKGNVLVPAMTLPQMQASYPDLAKQIKTTTASAYAGIGDIE